MSVENLSFYGYKISIFSPKRHLKLGISSECDSLFHSRFGARYSRMFNRDLDQPQMKKKVCYDSATHTYSLMERPPRGDDFGHNFEHLDPKKGN